MSTKERNLYQNIKNMKRTEKGRERIKTERKKPNKLVRRVFLPSSFLFFIFLSFFFGSLYLLQPVVFYNVI